LRPYASYALRWRHHQSSQRVLGEMRLPLGTQVLRAGPRGDRLL
jgi:hypothetical protein